jgi:hypothetical protein
MSPRYTALTGDFTNDGAIDVAFINKIGNQISFYVLNPAGGCTWCNIDAVGAGNLLVARAAASVSLECSACR